MQKDVKTTTFNQRLYNSVLANNKYKRTHFAEINSDQSSRVLQRGEIAAHKTA